MKKRGEMKKELKEWIGNEIGDEGAKAIGESLKINTSLTSLDLYGDEKIRNEKQRMKMKRGERMNREPNRIRRS